MSYESVVKVLATTQMPDYDCPWQTRSPEQSSGSGVVIGPGRILTGAHVVANATFLQIQKMSHPDKVVARIHTIAHDLDLALLEVDDPNFTSGIQPPPLGTIPNLGDYVSVVGYPIGGEEVCVTEGVVSRLEIQEYAHSRRDILAATVDAAINDGNSGSPVFLGRDIVGIAFQAMRDAENIAEIVPAPIIKKFLDGVREKKSPLLPSLGITTQPLENAFMRRKLGLEPTASGVLVTSIEHDGTADGVLQAGDALLSIATYDISNNGTIQYKGTIRTDWNVILGQHHVGDHIQVKVLRNGSIHTPVLTLKPPQELVPRSTFDMEAPYLIYGGLVIQPLTRAYLETWDDWWEKAPTNLLHHYHHGAIGPKRREVLLLTQVLADEVNIGYQSLQNEVIEQVNGQTPEDMQDLVKMINQANGVVELTTSNNIRVLLDTAAVRDAHQRILQRYRVYQDRSRHFTNERLASVAKAA